MTRYHLINLLIADDHQLITEGLSQMLKFEKTIGEIHTANNGKEAVDKALTNYIDCVINTYSERDRDHRLYSRRTNQS